MKINLRPYQTKLYEDIRSSMMAGNKRILAVLATGGGKTFTFSYMGKMALDKHKTVWFCAHRKNLLGQISSSIKVFGIRHGFVKGGKPKQYYLKAQVASIPSLYRRLGKLPTPDLIIIDEAHHVDAKTWSAIMEYYKDTYIVGFTATPTGSQGQGLGDHFDDMVVSESTGSLIEDGYLVNPRVFCPESSINLGNVRITAGDFNSKDVYEEVSKPVIVGDAIEHYRSMCHQMPGILFCVNVEHAINVAKEFAQAGYRTTFVHGGLDEVENENRLKGLADGTFHIVTSCNLISEGTDVPAVTYAGMLRPTWSERLYLQMAGRILRPVYAKDGDLSTKEGRLKAIAEGPKPCAYLFDHVQNTKIYDSSDELICGRHDYPVIDRDWSLESKKKKVKKGDNAEATIPTKTCSNVRCGYMWIGVSNVCPSCATAREIKKREIAQVKGALVELSESELKRKKVQEAKKQARKEVGMSNTLEQLYEIVKSRGYKVGWLKHKFESKVMSSYEKGYSLSKHGIEGTVSSKLELKRTIDSMCLKFISKINAKII